MLIQTIDSLTTHWKSGPLILATYCGSSHPSLVLIIVALTLLVSFGGGGGWVIVSGVSGRLKGRGKEWNE